MKLLNTNLLEVMSRLSMYDGEKQCIMHKKEGDAFYSTVIINQLQDYTVSYLSRTDARLVPKEWAKMLEEHHGSTEYAFTLKGSGFTVSGQKILWDEFEITPEGTGITVKSVGRNGVGNRINLDIGQYSENSAFGIWKQPPQKKVARVTISYFIDVPADAGFSDISNGLNVDGVSLGDESSHDHDIDDIEIRNSDEW